MITKYTPFQQLEELFQQLEQMPDTGTRIVVFDLNEERVGKDFKYADLDFDQQGDIRISRAEIQGQAAADASVMQSENKINSLREYCAILFLPRQQGIYIQGEKVLLPTWRAKPFDVREIAT